MAKRAFLIKLQALAEIFEYRGQGWGSVVRIGGELMPEDAKICGFAYVPPRNAWALVYQSATWPEDALVIPGKPVDKVNGVTIVEGSICHLRIVGNITENPLCQVTELDGKVAESAPPAETEPCATTNDG